jgi:hypothetical protein
MTKIDEILRKYSSLVIECTEEDPEYGFYTAGDVSRAMIEYADYRVKQCLDLVVDNVSIDVYDVEDEDKPEDYIYVDQECVAIDYDSILNIKLPNHN